MTAFRFAFTALTIALVLSVGCVDAQGRPRATTPPPTPPPLVGTISNTAATPFTLTWSAVSTATSYLISYREFSGTTAYYQQAGISSTNPTFSIPFFNGDHSYYVGVKAVNAQGVSSTQETFATINNRPVNGVAAVQPDGSLLLTWDAPVGNSDTLQYSYFSIDTYVNGASTPTTATPATNSFTRAADPPGTTLRFDVRTFSVQGLYSLLSADINISL